MSYYSFYHPTEGRRLSRPTVDLVWSVCAGWMYVGMVGGALFIILQLILLVDFAHNWHSRW